MWRTGPFTRHPAVARMHGLREGEHLLGWLYVGGRGAVDRPQRRTATPAAERFSALT
jgi:hypothetical protein